MLERYIRKQRNRISTKLGYRIAKIRDDDTYIAAHPRSGSTWLRTMLTNLLVEAATGSPAEFNERIPAISIRNSLKIRRLPSPRIIMTHGVPRPKMNRLIYLVRDGRDALISYYYYCGARANRFFSFEEFLTRYERQEFGLPWHLHVDVWGNFLKRSACTGLMVKYEDLKKDTPGSLMKVCQFIGLAYSFEECARAVQLATLEHARIMERRLSKHHIAPEQSFYRSGQVGGWKAEIPQEQLARFNEKAATTLQRLGYQQ